MDSASVTNLMSTAMTAQAPIALNSDATTALLRTLTAQIEIKEQLTKSAVSYVTAGVPHGVRFTHCEITRDSMPVEAALRAYHFNTLRATLDLEHSTVKLLALGFKGTELGYFSAFKNVTHMVSRTLDTTLFKQSPTGKAIAKSKRLWFHDMPCTDFEQAVVSQGIKTGVLSPEWALKLGVAGALRLMGMLKLERLHVMVPTPFELLFDCAKVEHYQFIEYDVLGSMESYVAFIQTSDPVPLWTLGNMVKGNFVPNTPCTMPAWYRFWERGKYGFARLTALAEGVSSNVRYEAIVDVWKQWLMCYPGIQVANRLNHRGKIYAVRGTAMAAHWSSLRIDLTSAEVAYTKCDLVLPSYRRCYLVRSFSTGYVASGRADNKHYNVWGIDHFVPVPCAVVDELRQYASRNTDATFDKLEDALALLHTALRKTISTLVISANQVSTMGPMMTTEDMRSLVVALVIENYIMRAKANKVVAHNMTPSSFKSALERLAEVVIDSNWFGTAVTRAIYGEHAQPLELIKPGVWQYEFEMRVFKENVVVPRTVCGPGVDSSAGLALDINDLPDGGYDVMEDVDPLLGLYPEPSAPDASGSESADDMPQLESLEDASASCSDEESDEPVLLRKGKEPEVEEEEQGSVSSNSEQLSASSSATVMFMPPEPLAAAPEETPEWAKQYIAECPRKFEATWDPKSAAVVLSTPAGPRLITEAAQHVEPTKVAAVQTSWGPPEMRVFERPSGAHRPHPVNTTKACEEMRKTLPPKVKPSHWTLQATLSRCKCTHDSSFPCLCTIAYRLTGTYMHCNGKAPQTVTFALSPTQVSQVINVLQASKIPADPILARVFASKCVAGVGITAKAKVAFVEAPPGCGKTHLITTLAKELAYRGVSYHVCVPLAELAGDYGSIDIPSATDTATFLISKGTQTYWAVRSYDVTKGEAQMRNGVKVLIIDEAWLAAGEHVILAVAHLKPELVYIVGDSYQNEMPSNMVVKSFGSIIGKSEFQAGKLEHCVHRLVFNFRNPPAVVDVLNKHYYAHSPMVAMSKRTGRVAAYIFPEGDEAYSSHVVDEQGDPVPFYCMYPSNATGAKMASKHKADVAVKNTGNSVLASQGLTRRCVKVYLTERDAAAYKHPELMRVMLSRHTEELVFVLDGKNPAGAMAFLSGLGIGVELANRLQNQKPVSTSFVPKQVEMPEVKPKEKAIKADFGAAKVLMEPPVDAAEPPHANEDARFTPLSAKVRTYEQEPDAMKVDREEKRYQTRYQLSYVPHALMQTSAAAEAQRTALARYNLAHSKIQTDAGTHIAVKNLATSVFSKTKDLSKLRAFWQDSELHHVMWLQFLEDNRAKHTFNKADGMSDIDEYVVGGANGKFLDYLWARVVHMSQKAGIKMINNTKDFDLFKAGQGVSSFSPMLTITMGYMMRLLNRADMLSNIDAKSRLEGHRSEWTIIEHNGRNPEDVATDLAAVFAMRTDIPQVAITDMPKADSSISQAEYMLSFEWDKLLLSQCPDRIVEMLPYVHLFYHTLSSNVVIVPGQIKFRTEAENLSGHSGTLMITSRCNKCQVVEAMADSQGPKLMSGVGDDGLAAASVLKWNHDAPLLVAYRKYSHITFSVTDARGSACDFVGHVIHVVGTKITMIPSLIRRFERAISRPWRNAEEFLGTKQAMLDYFINYADRRDEIIAAAANILAFRSGLNSDVCDMIEFVRMAELYWAAYDSLSHWSAQDFWKHAKRVQIRVAL